MANKLILLICTWMILSSGCKTLYKKSMDIEVLEDSEVVQYANGKQYKFDLIWRLRDHRYFEQLKPFGINSFLFVNLYDQKGQLIKKEEGEKCEINIMNSLKDSSYMLKGKMQACDTCQIQNAKKYFREIHNPQRQETNNRIVVLIGWGTFYQEQRFIQKRTELVNNMIEEIKQKHPDFVIVGLSFDPYVESN
jgi:hypothetical protein